MAKISHDSIQLIGAEREIMLAFLRKNSPLNLVHFNYHRVECRDPRTVALPEDAVGFQYYEKIVLELCFEGQRFKAAVADPYIIDCYSDDCDFANTANFSPIYLPGGTLVPFEKLPVYAQEYFTRNCGPTAQYRYVQTRAERPQFRVKYS